MKKKTCGGVLFRESHQNTKARSKSLFIHYFAIDMKKDGLYRYSAYTNDDYIKAKALRQISTNYESSTGMVVTGTGEFFKTFSVTLPNPKCPLCPWLAITTMSTFSLSTSFKIS